jgi:hypothetical protein
MLKTILPFGIGFAVGGMAIYAAYKYFKSKDPNNEKLRKEAEYEAKTKLAEERLKKLHDLINNQSYVENLSSKDLSAWFKENKAEFGEGVKMIIAVPTDDALKGLGYPITEPIDKDKNILQWFYDENAGKVLKIRLVNFTNIDSNFQTHLLENNGMIVVAE